MDWPYFCTLHILVNDTPMNPKKLYLLLLLLLCVAVSEAQTYVAKTLVEKRSYYLNGGTRAVLGGKSRTTLKIDLPPNTKRWYYSFTTTPEEEGTKLLNLGIQLSAALYGGGLAGLASKAISVPPGSGAADVLVLPPKEVDHFLTKANYTYYRDISLENARQAVQSVERNYGKTVYLGLRNPSAVMGIGIVIEVVAIVEVADDPAGKGKLYGDLGWKELEKGNYEACLELCQKALSHDPNLGYVKFNLALVHLILEDGKAIDAYVAALADLKKDRSPKNTLQRALQEVKDWKVKNPSLPQIDLIEELLSKELAKQ